MPALPAVVPSEVCGSELLEDELAEGLGCCVLLLCMEGCCVLVDAGVATGLALVESTGVAVLATVRRVAVELDVVAGVAVVPRSPVRARGVLVVVAAVVLTGPVLLLTVVARGPLFVVGVGLEVGFELVAGTVLVRFTGPVSSAFLLSPAVTTAVGAVLLLLLLFLRLFVAVFSLAPMAAATARAVAMVDEDVAVEVIFVGGLSFEIYCRVC